MPTATPVGKKIDDAKYFLFFLVIGWVVASSSFFLIGNARDRREEKKGCQRCAVFVLRKHKGTEPKP